MRKMANKFVVVPEEIYRGLTTSDTGNINLDFIRRELEKTRRERTNPSAKNVHYNQELRRYLHLLKEHLSQPVNVAITGGDQPIPIPLPPSFPQSRRYRRRDSDDSDVNSGYRPHSNSSRWMDDDYGDVGGILPPQRSISTHHGRVIHGRQERRRSRRNQSTPYKSVDLNNQKKKRWKEQDRTSRISISNTPSTLHIPLEQNLNQSDFNPITFQS